MIIAKTIGGDDECDNHFVGLMIVARLTFYPIRFHSVLSVFP